MFCRICIEKVNTNKVEACAIFSLTLPVLPSFCLFSLLKKIEIVAISAQLFTFFGVCFLFDFTKIFISDWIQTRAEGIRTRQKDDFIVHEDFNACFNVYCKEVIIVFRR